ncbi:uncharacterized protein LOC123318843 [Coccinella septempunctata]|uniref:uncharacterized protein LOC123318843 n=1 Tax=Coccinella septempunctata TaxID=41139 RepID=UPI001D094808|nr:uncharacterized protein LOC123318843 [Coccinella septempunctata]
MLGPTRHHRRNLMIYFYHCILSLLLIRNVSSDSGDVWPLDRPSGMPSIQSLDVMCGKDHMDVHLTFSQPFEGIVSSKGQHGDPRCVYVPPSTGQTFFSFRIAYARCGTKPDLHGQFYENTVVVQYDKDLLEVWDEAKRLRCEWFNDYEKTATKPPMVIADLDVIQLDFRGDNVDCWMEIQHGKGPWAPPVTGIVPLGSTLTLVVAINDYRGEFDMRVKSCVASDGGGHVIQLSDEYGCVLRPKMISRFLKARGADERASVITYAFFHAFKFPDALSVHIKCKVEICRHGCLDHCQLEPEAAGGNQHDFGHQSIDRTDTVDSDEKSPDPANDIDNEDVRIDTSDVAYDDILHHNGPATFEDNDFPAVNMPLKSEKEDRNSNDKDESQEKYVRPVVERQDDSAGQEITAVPHKDLLQSMQEKFPHGPRSLDHDLYSPSPRSLSDDAPRPDSSENNVTDDSLEDKTHRTRRIKRRRRSLVISDRKVRSADVGVSGLYDVISEADLAFSPDGRAEAVTVFQGRIREEVVYGICMPVPGFSLLFILVAVSAVVSALVAGSLLYRYQLQKEHMAEEAHRSISLSVFSNWIGHRFLGARNAGVPSSIELRETNGSVDNSLVMASMNGKSEDLHRRQ